MRGSIVQRSSSRGGRVPENVYAGRRCAPQALTLAHASANGKRAMSTVQSSANMQNGREARDNEPQFSALLERVKNEFGLNSLFFHVNSPFRSVSGESYEPESSEGECAMDPLGVVPLGPAPSTMQSPGVVSQAEFQFLSLAERGNEDLVRLWAAELVLAVDMLHRNGLVLRDLHLENVLVRSDGHLMLSYFDTSCRLCNVCRNRNRKRPNGASVASNQRLLGTLNTRSASANAIATCSASRACSTRCCCFAVAAFNDVALRRGNVAPELIALGSSSKTNDSDSSLFASPRRQSNVSAPIAQSTAFAACDWWSECWFRYF